MSSFACMGKEDSYAPVDQDGGARGRKQGTRKTSTKKSPSRKSAKSRSSSPKRSARRQSGGAPSTNISGFVDLAVPFALLWASKGIEMIPKMKKSQSGGAKKSYKKKGQSGGFLTEDDEDIMQGMEGMEGGAKHRKKSYKSYKKKSQRGGFMDLLDEDDSYENQEGGRRGRRRGRKPKASSRSSSRASSRASSKKSPKPSGKKSPSKSAKKSGQKGGALPGVSTNASLFAPSDILKDATDMASRALPNSK